MSDHAFFADVADQQLSTMRTERYSFSLADQAADVTRRDIIRGRIRSGEKLNERTLAEKLGMGQDPAREALLHLKLGQPHGRPSGAGGDHPIGLCCRCPAEHQGAHSGAAAEVVNEWIDAGG